MRGITLVLVFLLGAGIGRAQTLERVNHQLDSLTTLRGKVTELLKKIDARMVTLESEKNRILLDQAATQGIPGRVSFAGTLRTEATAVGSAIIEVPRKAEVRVISFVNGYYRVKYDRYVGYLNEMYIEESESLGILKGQTSSLTKSSSEPTSVSAPVSTGRVIHTGPRGGRYYINSKGNKVYIKRK